MSFDSQFYHWMHTENLDPIDQTLQEPENWHASALGMEVGFMGKGVPTFLGIAVHVSHCVHMSKP